MLALSVSRALAADPATRITVEGNRRVESATVRSYFHPAADGHYDAAALDAALKGLIGTGLFDQVRIDRAGDGIVVRLTEARLLGRVAFEGNKKIKDQDLAAAVQSKPGVPFQRATVQADVGRVMEVYRHIGREEVQVVPETIERGNDTVDLVFTITEGKKATVRQINFVGNHAFSRRQLAAVINTSATNVLSFLTHTDIYDPDRVAQDRAQLRRYYRNHGYADAGVTDARAEYDSASQGFAVTFVIDEGEPYRLGSIGLESHVSGIDPEQLRARISARSGVPFDNSLLDKSSEALALEMEKLGFPFAHVTLRTNRNAEARRIDVTFVIKEGPRSYIERIAIHGNTRTRDYVIRREFDLAEGDAYNQTLVDRAERRLKSLNYFKDVKITTRPGSANDRVVLDVETVDQPTGDFFVSGGYSTTDGWLGEVKLGDRNFLGTGAAVQARVGYGQYSRGVDLSVSEPDIFDSRATAGAELFGRQTFASTYQSYGTDTYGANFTLATPMAEETSVQWRYSMSNQSVTLAPTSSGTTVSLPIQQAAAAGPALVSGIGSTTTYSTLDNTKSPTSGVNSQLRQDLAGLGGDVRFLRTTGDVRHYQSLGGDLVGLVRAQGGYITGWGGQQAPLINSFFGGPGMVRGFAPNGFGPRDLTSGSTMDNVGGSLYWATTAELQSGIPGLPNEYGLKGSAFVDAGSVFRYTGPTTFGGQTVNVANSNILRSSVGVGLTWASPFGALAINYALPITKAAYDVTQPFNFTASPF
ncbi:MULTISPECIES: outer membrane protein assembly factor BamA [unclassified Bradyrhizobium]|uniref:outer membrane protein assembly factor BamA n=1 Tax=unclassified Bradyrhizobium TaxID=2631580 RepID=UPI00247A3970|nr:MULTISPECIES: outer membrane protein assembly factor BamA [unclassified Bradyrhizobium]WGS23893.1 outer membrane protein assembly factor BamA [Bradyrhizobium sp. ISRA463]WGS31207.1 outer membrane protein assembly factor BamA [Bradyrhizobium sp. ISRA464]